MRHRVAGRKLSRHSQHRSLMFRNMLVSLIEHERLKTTLAKAKELRKVAEKIVTLGKKDSLHARRLAFALLRNEDIVKKLFTEIAPRFKDRQGGYTRIYKLGWRAGDAAPLSLIEWVTLSAEEEKKKSAVKKAKEALKKVVPKKKGAAEKPEAEKKEKKIKATKAEKEGKETKKAKKTPEVKKAKEEREAKEEK
ncbi:MAG: 50S ribosomal protein L17 [Deltaproteobacteria bacterium]